MSDAERTTGSTLSEGGTGDWRLIRKVLPYLRDDLPLYLTACAMAPVSAALVVVQPWLLKKAIDDAILPADASALEQIALLYLGAVLIAFVAEAAYTLSISYAATRSITRLRDDVFRHTLSLSQSFFDREPTGKLLTRVTSDVEALGETLSAGAFTLVLDVILVLGILGAMVALDPALTLTLLLVGPPLALVVELIRRRLRKLYLSVRTTLATLNAYAAERITGVEVVQLYSDEERVAGQFEDRLLAYRNATINTNVWDALLYAIVDGLTSITMALILWYAGSGWLESVVTAGLLAAFIEYVGKLFTPIRELSSKLAILQRATTALEKIFSLLDHDEHITPGDTPLPDEPGDVELDGTSFAYGAGPTVLDDLHLTVSPGEVVALVGRTGSGKTTVGRVLLRAYDGYTGSVRIDGVELSRVRPDDLRRRITVVQQDVVLYPGDVRFNLTLGSDLDDERLWDAIGMAQATDVVRRLGGLDGRIEHGGRNVSVGEAQLLSFARTLAHDAPLVILDEATASVDTLTEARIQAATGALLEQRTVLVVAHRLSTIVGADRIVVLDAGHIVQMGSHAELLAQPGAYADLFHSQFEEHNGTQEDQAGTAS
ncbi:MAG: ABC transporter ATP-binding protein/permease [Myxococcales bacterium]|nr:ABC transporter ATP-binding protein/permease [Myxococcales bacterium]